MSDNVFIHDAVPTWSGFLYQGQIAVYLAVKKIGELDAADKKEDVSCYSIEMEKCEDIAVVYEEDGNKQYQSIHQVKNYEKKGIGEYRNPLIQLMLEKGFCQKNGYGTPSAYLHVSREISIKSEETFENKVTGWKDEIIQFYKTLYELHTKLEQDGDKDEILKNIKECMDNNPIKFNRSEYRKILEKVKEANSQNIKEGMNELFDFLDQKLCVPQIDENIEIYSYDTEKSYCSGTEIFGCIVNQVMKYKYNKGRFTQEQYEYIADKLLWFVESKILERHQCMQEGNAASTNIPLNEFLKILDEGIERYEEEANILTLIRKYDERIEAYCSVCQNKEECSRENCKLQQPDIRRNILEKDVFVRLCYNLNPECTDEITNRACLSELLNEDGMVDSVFTSLKAIPEKYFVAQEDKSRFEVRNHEKVAFLTAISSKHGHLAAEKIEKALSVNQDLIVNVFEADQLVTTRLKEPSSIWDSSSVKIRKDDLLTDENVEEDGEHSIYVAKKPEFITAEGLIKEIGIK